MNLAPRTCATCSSFNPVHGCWASVNRFQKSGALQAWHEAPGPNDSCKKHQTKLESEAQDAALYAFWQPLLIKSRWAAARSKGCKDMQ
jgi:hypothetical protein